MSDRPDQCLILAGGRGTRLGALTDEIPKPMLSVSGQPFLARVIEHVERQGVGKIIISAGYKHEVITEFVAMTDFGSLEVVCSVEEEPAGTAGAIKVSEPLLDDIFYLMNGDTFFGADWHQLPLDEGDIVTIGLAHVADVSRFGRVDTNNNRVIGFREKSEIQESGVINAGVYRVRKQQLLDEIESLPCSFEHDILPQLVSNDQVAALLMDGEFIDIGIPGDFARAQELFK